MLQMTKKIHKTLEKTKFAGCAVVPIAARPGGPEVGDTYIRVLTVHPHE